MNRHITFGLGILAGIAIGATAIDRLHAQAKAPGAYAIVDISAITDPEGMKALGPKAGPAATAAGGHFIARTENIVALTGTPPKRFVIIGFDNIEKAKAWYATPAQKEVNDIAAKSTTQRMFVVEGMTN